MTGRAVLREPPRRCISFRICGFLPRHLVKGKSRKKGNAREAPPPSPPPASFFLPALKRRERPAQTVWIGSERSTSLSHHPFLRLRFANSSLICRKPIVSLLPRHRRRRHVQPWKPFLNGERACARCRRMIYRNAKCAFSRDAHCGHSVKGRWSARSSRASTSRRGVIVGCRHLVKLGNRKCSYQSRLKFHLYIRKQVMR